MKLPVVVGTSTGANVDEKILIDACSILQFNLMSATLRRSVDS